MVSARAQVPSQPGPGFLSIHVCALHLRWNLPWEELEETRWQGWSQAQALKSTDLGSNPSEATCYLRALGQDTLTNLSAVSPGSNIICARCAAMRQSHRCLWPTQPIRVPHRFLDNACAAPQPELRKDVGRELPGRSCRSEWMGTDRHGL